MAVVFGEMLTSLLRNTRYTQQGLIEWLAANQSGSQRFRTSNSIKEHLRVSKAAGLPATEYPLIFSIARFFEEKGDPAAASRIRHIYLQQSYDKGIVNQLYNEATPHSEGVAWLVFPELDRATIDLHYSKWRSQLYNGDRLLLRDSLNFYKQYSRSYPHSPIRQLIALDLARVAVTSGEYVDAFVIASGFSLKWREFLDRSDERKGKYNPVLWDLYQHLAMLQVKAGAASYIFEDSPLMASSAFFFEAYRQLYRQRRILSRHPLLLEGLKIQWHTRFLRMLCRARMGLAENDGADMDLKRHIQRLLIASRKRLEGLIANTAAWDKSEFIQPYLVMDTLARSWAIAATTHEEIQNAVHYLEGSVAVMHRPGRPGDTVAWDLRKYRRATTEAVISACQYRVALLNEDSEATLLFRLEQATVAIRDLSRSVPAYKKMHAKFTADRLTIFLQSIALKNFPMADVLSSIRDCRLSKIYEQIEILQDRATAEAGLLFVVNPDDPLHLECMLQANIFRHSKPEQLSKESLLRLGGSVIDP